MDGSTDKDRVENELFVILFCKQDDTLQEVDISRREYVLSQEQSQISNLFLTCFLTAGSIDDDKRL